MAKDGFKAGRPQPDYPPAKVRNDPPPPRPDEPVYYDGARFLVDPSRNLLIEIKADDFNLVGPKPAVDEDKITFARAWAAFDFDKAKPR